MGIDKDFLYMSDEYQDCPDCGVRYPVGNANHHLGRITALFNITIHKLIYKKHAYMDAYSANLKFNGKTILTYAQAHAYDLIGEVKPINVLGTLEVKEKKKV